MLPKIRQLRDTLGRKGLATEIEVDGGINAETAKKAVAAGATMLVAGNYIYNSNDPIAAIKALKAQRSSVCCAASIVLYISFVCKEFIKPIHASEGHVLVILP